MTSHDDDKGGAAPLAPSPAPSPDPLSVQTASSSSPTEAGAVGTPSLDTPDTAPPPSVGPPRDFRRLLRRFGPAVVAIVIAVFASPLAERWPSKQSIEVAIDRPTEVTRVTLEVAARGESEPIYSTAWNFNRGSAPERVRAEMATPDGPYDATIRVFRTDDLPRDETKRVALDGNRITLFAR